MNTLLSGSLGVLECLVLNEPWKSVIAIAVLALTKHTINWRKPKH